MLIQEETEYKGNIQLYEFEIFICSHLWLISLLRKRTQAMWFFCPRMFADYYMLKCFTWLCLKITYSVSKRCLMGIVVWFVWICLCSSRTLCNSAQSFPHVYCSSFRWNLLSSQTHEGQGDGVTCYAIQLIQTRPELELYVIQPPWLPFKLLTSVSS